MGMEPDPLLAVLDTPGWVSCSVELGKRQALKHSDRFLHYFLPPLKVPLPPHGLFSSLFWNSPFPYSFGNKAAQCHLQNIPSPYSLPVRVFGAVSY